MIKVSCDLPALDNGTVIMLLIVLMSPLQLVKCCLQLTASEKCQIRWCGTLV